MRGLSLPHWYLLRRGAWMWLLTRVALLGALLFAGATGGAEPPNLFGPMPASVAVAVALGFVEARRLAESAFFANLGIARRAQVVMLAIGGVVGECALAILRGFA